MIFHCFHGKWRYIPDACHALHDHVNVGDDGGDVSENENVNESTHHHEHDDAPRERKSNQLHSQEALQSKQSTNY